jgi:SAM-dependent methyltransferase
LSEPDHVARNRELWTKTNAEYTDDRARRAWAAEEITWGVFGVPEAEVGILGDVAGLDVIELGCGTAGIEFPLVEASAEDVPLPDASFDLAVSEYGASLWCDPARWLAETARLLRPQGRLVFLTNSMLAMLCVPDEPGYATENLLRPQKGMYRVTWPFEDGVEFHVGHGEWIDLLHGAGFEVERLVELFAPEGAKTHEFYDTATADWARKWPAEDLWAARKIA